MERPLAMTTEQPACGLGSLLSMSCRDRAEAFARRLQSRLQTLGLGAAPDAASSPPTSPPAPGDAPSPDASPDGGSQARPPLLLGSSSDSDLFYDFDLEPQSPASPAEEALELVVAQQPRTTAESELEARPLREPEPEPESESGCMSSFFGTSPGSDSSEAFASPSSSPAWFMPRRRSSTPPTYEKCNGHTSPPTRQNGSATLLIGNGSANMTRDYGSTRSQDENESLHTSTENNTENISAVNVLESSLWHDETLHTLLDEGSGKNILENGPVHSLLDHGSETSLYDNGSVRLHLQDTFASLDSSTEDVPSNEKYFKIQNNNTESIKNQNFSVHQRNALNLESRRELQHETDVTESLESISIRDDEEQQNFKIEDNQELIQIKSELQSNISSEISAANSTASNESQDEEIQLLPSEHINEEQYQDRERDVDEQDTCFTFREDWEDRFSDYCAGDTFSEKNEEESENTVNESAELEDVGLNKDEDCSTYQSIFTRTSNITLECPPESIMPKSELDEETPSLFMDVSNQSIWERLDETGPRMMSTLVINQEENLDESHHVPENSRTELAKEVLENGVEKDVETISSALPPPQVVCEFSPDDEESEEESSKEEDEDKPKPEPRRRPKPADSNEDEDQEESPRQQLRRCSSLKTGKTPPGTPHRKKIVRFADVLGLDLADVRTFLDEIPRIPSSAYDDLTDADLSLESVSKLAPAVPINTAFSTVAGPDPSSALSLSLSTPTKMLMPTFQQPGGQSDFLERIRTKFVCLENAIVNDVATSSIAGVVRVRNLDFHKSVYVRYSNDGWKTYSDLQATYMPNSCDGFSDKFSFVLFAHTLTIGQRLEFAVRFHCKGSQYWDSNGGSNYGFQCLPASSSAPYMPLPSPDDRWGSFY